MCLRAAPEDPHAHRSSLLRVLDGARLADDGDLDLARIGQLLLDLAHDVAREAGGREVIDLLGADEDPDLAPGLDGKRALDALEAVGDRLEVLEALDVRVHRLAASARSGRADRVGDLDDRRLDAGVFDLLMVGADRVHDLRGEVVALGDRGADRGVRALDLVVDGLADVVEQPGGLGDLDVGPDLCTDHRREPARLDDVVEDVLAVARPVLEPAEQLDELRRQARDAAFVRGGLAGLTDDQIDLRPGLGHDLLDAAGMDPAVTDELRERDPGYLAANRVEARQDDRFRGVIDDQIDPGRLFERPDVAALATDDPTLHLVVGEMDDRHRVLGRVVGGDALDRGDDDVTSLLVGFLAGSPFDRACELHGVVLRFLADGLEEQTLRLVGRHAADPLERHDLLLVGLCELL